MDFETRTYRQFVAALIGGTLAGIAAGSLVAWLLDIELSGGDALWLYAGGGLLGLLIAVVLGWRSFVDV